MSAQPDTSQANPPSHDSQAPSLPGVPRPTTSRARWRSWAEMPVRIWMILAVLILLVFVYFTASRIHQALTDRWLVRNGVDVKAKFTSVNGDPVPKRRPRQETMPASITFQYNGKQYNLDVPRLEEKPGAFAMVDSDVYGMSIKIDPNNPARWTEARQPKPWSQELAVVAMMLPVVLILIGITWWKRRGVINTWRYEPLAAGSVVEVRHTGMAPMSRLVRFTLPDTTDRRVFSTLMPTRAGVPSPGQTIWLIVPPNRPDRSIVARLYA